jgi:hypothetical protein
LLEVEGRTMGGVINFLDESVDELILGIKAEDVGSEEDLSDVSSSLAWISIEREESV